MPDSSSTWQNIQETRLLIVDDEPHIRSSLVRALTLLDYTVDDASSGQEALTKLEQVTYQLMVLDMHMPGVDGVEVMIQARQLQPEVLIIVLTGYPTLDNAITALKLDAVDYLRKPASIRRISDTIDQALRKHAKRVYQQRLVDTMTQALESLRQLEKSMATTSADMPPTDLEKVPPLTLDRGKLQVTVADNPDAPIRLSEGEASVLASLIAHSDQVRSCRELVRDTWGYDTDEADAESVIRPYIFRLRRKIEVMPKRPRVIRTVRRRGYMLSTVESGVGDAWT